ncbi:MAG: dUTP diphosphatase [Candidatus Gastranaerophilales bacterium]|nr:dUTP diphosphatase [Candidatus Gastranaerophilales bacterium]
MKFKPELKIYRLKNNLTMPSYATEGSAGMDLTAAISEPCEFKPFERKLIQTGIIIELPEGYEAQIRSRSGLSIKHGMTLVNCVGTIDEDYRGEICVPMINLSQEAYTINPGDRIAQMIISSVQKVDIIEVREVSSTSRSSGGFGSTGY